MGKYDKFREKLKSDYKQLPEGKIIAWIEANFEFRTRKNGEEYQICDPFDYDTNFRFGINPEVGVCHSWHGDLWAGPINPKTRKRNCSFINFVKIYKKCSYRQALAEVLGSKEDISDYMKADGRIGNAEAERKVSVALPGGVEILSTSEDRQGKILRKWLGTRGYTQESIELAELYHLGMDVYWPYFEFEILVYWQARSRLNKRFAFPNEDVWENGKIVGKTEGTKGDFFYGFDSVDPASYLIITEAIFDKNTLGEQTLASGGADLTTNQIKKLKILGPRKGIILAPDNDYAGINSVIKNRELLSANDFTVYCSIPPKYKYEEDGEVKTTKDWNEISMKLNLTNSQVRKIHDDNIKKITAREILRLKKLLPTR